MASTAAAQFGRNLRWARRRNGLTQMKLAVKAGISASQVHRLEAGLREPRLQTIVKLGGALDVDPVDLLRGIE